MNLTVQELANRLLLEDEMAPNAVLAVKDVDTGRISFIHDVELEFHEEGSPTLWLKTEDH